VLDHAFEGVSSCLRCEGLWIAPATLDAAFGNPRWPLGNAMWWRNSVECPECTFEGKATVMAARMSNDVIVDQCADHGLWLDRGELGRLMGVAANELVALRERLAATAPDLDQLVARRQKWRADLETRRRATLEYRQTLEQEHRHRAAIAEAERKRLDPTARATSGTALTQEMSPIARPAARNEPPPAAPDPRDLANRAMLATQRAQALAEVARHQDRVVALEAHVRRLEDELSETKRRVSAVNQELDAARAKLRMLDDQLDGA
jgi:Zn-finger nucleic acid-binding protein